MIMTLKRLAAPKFWRIEKKTKKFVVKPLPGPHSKDRCLPIGIILRDMLGYAYTMKEAKTILKNCIVKVDGKIKTQNNFPVGLMDVVSVGDEFYRVLPDSRGLTVKKIAKNESKTKLLRIENKICIKKNKIQLNLHDGKNIVVESNDHGTNDVLVFDIEGKTIKDVLRFEKGSKALITKGNNIGSVVIIKDNIITKSSMPNQAVVELDGRSFTLPVSYLFVVGRDKPVVDLGEQL